MSRYTNIVYIGRYLVLTYIERFISTVCCFFSYICWSVNCMSWVSKFNNFFLTCRETEARFIFEGFNIVLYGKFISDFWIMAHTLEMSRNVSINLYLRPCGIAIYGKFYLYCLYHLRLFSGLQIVDILSLNYVLHFGRVKIHKHCLYWGVCSTGIMERLFSTVCYILS